MQERKFGKTGLKTSIIGFGGFHLLEPSEERMRGTLEYLKKLDPECIHACHCTDLNSKIELSKVCRLKEVGVGLQIEYY